MSKEAARILRKARKILVEKGWTKGAYAANASGTSVDTGSRTAEKFCSVGAIDRARGNQCSKSYGKALALLYKATGSEDGILLWNDSPRRTKKQVIAAFDKAIKLAEES